MFSDLKKTIQTAKKYGLREAARKIYYKLFLTRRVVSVYSKKLSKTEVEQQSSFLFSNPRKFSILTPLYNTNAKMLRELLESVINQTYQNWELCLADGSDASHGYIETIVHEYAQKDERICYKKLSENKGISGNTNEAIKIASGNYFSLLDHDDILHQSALFETMQVIESKNADMVYTDEAVFVTKITHLVHYHFKSDYAPDILRSHNYFCHFLSFSRQLYEQVGGFRSEYNGAQDYDMILRLSEVAKNIYHIPKILYFWRSHKASTAYSIDTKRYAIDAGKKAVAAHLERLGWQGTVSDSISLGVYRIRYKLFGNPLISILIPNKDHVADLKKCITSILECSTYRNFQIIVIENNSTEPDIFAYYEELQQLNASFNKAGHTERIEVIHYSGAFNYSAINNFGVKQAIGEYILLLNNDTKVISPDWMQELLMFCQRDDVGAVGAMLYYPNDTVQHAGIIVSLKNGETGHSHRYFPRVHPGYCRRLCCSQNVSAVTGACLMTRRSVFEQIGGLDEKFAVVYNDIDFCLKIRQAGYLIVLTPYAELYHYESVSRGYDYESSEKTKRFIKELEYFKTTWQKEITAVDPYYNPNFTHEKEDFSLADFDVTFVGKVTSRIKIILRQSKKNMQSSLFFYPLYRFLASIKNKIKN